MTNAPHDDALKALQSENRALKGTVTDLQAKLKQAQDENAILRHQMPKPPPVRR